MDNYNKYVFWSNLLSNADILERDSATPTSQHRSKIILNSTFSRRPWCFFQKDVPNIFLSFYLPRDIIISVSDRTWTLRICCGVCCAGRAATRSSVTRSTWSSSTLCTTISALLSTQVASSQFNIWWQCFRSGCRSRPSVLMTKIEELYSWHTKVYFCLKIAIYLYP